MMRPAVDPSQAQWLLRYSATNRPVVQSHLSAGFPAYARVLNPANGSDGAPVRWSRIAQEVGVALSAGTQWSDLAAPVHRAGELSDLDPPGWSPDPGVACALTSVLEPYTDENSTCYFLVWEGYAGVADHFERLGAHKIAMSPYRSFFLLTGSLEDVCAPFLPGDNRLPNRWWPENRRWCVGNEIYTRSVFVGGSNECIAAVLAHPDLEAYPAAPDSPAREELE